MADISLSNSASVARGGRGIMWAFCGTIFLSACLLFYIQPLFTRIVVPTIGGAPAVWTTAMLFFQSVLLAGYLYAHLMVRYVPARAQLWVHLALWGAALITLPLALPEGWLPDPDGSAVMQTLSVYAIGVGLPFAFLSANAPLIQAWYGRSGGPSADDPYFLYGASNLGSMGALIGFTLLAEPMVGIQMQTVAWAIGFVLLGAAFVGLGVILPRGGSIAAPAPRHDAQPVSADQIARWLILAFVPSSLMLAVTTKITTDLGTLPLFWVLPLVIYLLTFVATFTNRPWVPDSVLRPLCLLAIGAGFYLYGKVSFAPLMALIPVFAVIALYAHRCLYQARPAAGDLTFFYVIMSVGGAAGGLFNSIIAPLAFDTLFEGPATFALAGAMLFFVRDKAFRLACTQRHMLSGLAVLAVGAAVFVQAAWIITLAVLVVVVAALISLPRAAGLGAAMAGAVIAGMVQQPPNVIFQDRSFFGSHSVVSKPAQGLRAYVNGTTVHGYQDLGEMDDGAKPTPLSYYYPEGPMAQVLQSAHVRADASVGIVGLGVGALACYRRAGQDWHFYEIDPLVDRVARNPEFFTYMSTCAGDAPTHLGDARVVLAQQDALQFDALIIDAYSSNSVPVHLTTAEAMQLYIDRMSEDGVLVYHISNRYYRIAVPLARAADALGLHIWEKVDITEGGPRKGTSRVAIVTRQDTLPTSIAAQGGWEKRSSDGGAVWTDDLASPLGSLRWVYDRFGRGADQ